MENTIDVVVLILLIYYFWRGWRKGFLGSILGPISLVIGGVLSYLYYQSNPNLPVALGISVGGPFLVYITLSILIKIMAKATNSEDSKMSLVNRIVGSTFSIAWSGGMLLLILLLVINIPGSIPYVDKVHNYLSKTKTYSIVSKFTGHSLSSSESGGSPMIKFLENPEKFESLSNTKEFKNVMEHSKVKELLMDADLRQHLQEKNIGKLMASPKMQSLLGDKDLIKNFFSLQKKIMEESLEELDTKNLPMPEVIEIPEPDRGL